jgi:hypothetical protein
MSFKKTNNKTLKNTKKRLENSDDAKEEQKKLLDFYMNQSKTFEFKLIQ